MSWNEKPVIDDIIKFIYCLTNAGICLGLGDKVSLSINVNLDFMLVKIIRSQQRRANDHIPFTAM